MPTIEKRPFGRTGHMSSVTLFGAAALGQVTQKEADQTLEVLLEYGINHIDTAASYGDAEERIGPWMKEHRDKFFLATKTGDRDYKSAKKSIARSLKRMRVDQIDLIQLHALVHPDEWELAMSADGALKACIEARQQGLVKYIGVTGHGLNIAAMHRRSLERFDFDSILLPYNFVVTRDKRYSDDFERTVKLAQERNAAVQTIKSLLRGPWGLTDRFASTWYNPLTDQADIDRAVHWVIGRPGIFLNTIGDIHILPKVLDAASRFQRRPSDDEMNAMMGEQKMANLFA
ncbi:MAG: aldo/keto reductase [Caldilineaceae bacterium]